MNTTDIDLYISSDLEWTLAEKIRLLELYMDKDILWEKRAEILQEEFAKRRSTDFFTVQTVKLELHRIFSKPNPEHHIYGMPIHPRGKEAAELWLKHFRKELNEYRERQKQMFMVAMRHQLDLIRRYQQGKVSPTEVEAILTAAREKDAKRPNRELYEAKLEEMMGKIRSEDLKNIRTFSDYYRYIRGERVPTPPPEPEPEIEKPQLPQQIKSPCASPTRFFSASVPLLASHEPVLKDIQNNAKREGQLMEQETMVGITHTQPGPPEPFLPDLFMELDQSTSQTTVVPMAITSLINEQNQNKSKHKLEQIFEEKEQQKELVEEVKAEEANQIKKQEVFDNEEAQQEEEVFVDIYKQNKNEMATHLVDIVLPHNFAFAELSTPESVLAKCTQTITLISSKTNTHQLFGCVAENINAIPRRTEPLVFSIKMPAKQKPLKKPQQLEQSGVTTIGDEMKTIPKKAISPARKTTTYDSIAATIGLPERLAKTATTKVSTREKRRSGTSIEAVQNAETPKDTARKQRSKFDQKGGVCQQQVVINQRKSSIKAEQQKQQPQRAMRGTAGIGTVVLASTKTPKGIGIEPRVAPSTLVRTITTKANGTALTRKRKRGELDLLISGEPITITGPLVSEEIGPPAKNLRRTSSQQPSPATSVTDISTTPSSSISTSSQAKQQIKKEPKLERQSPALIAGSSLLLFPTPIQTTKITSSAQQQQHDARMEKASMLLQPSPIATPPIISEIAAATKLRSSLRRAAIASFTPSPAVNSVGENGLFMSPGNHKSTEKIPKHILLTLWKDIHSYKHFYVFDQPVSEAEVPGYHSAIKKPMDLKTLKGRIESGDVQTFGEFRRDIMLMFANAVLYNSTGHHVNTYAKEMFAYALKCIEVNQYPSGQWMSTPMAVIPSSVNTSVQLINATTSASGNTIS